MKTLLLLPRTLPLLLLTVALTACASLGNFGIVDVVETVQKVDEVQKKANEEFTPEQEYYIGRAVGANILAQYPAFDAAAANSYLNTIGQYLALVSDKPETFGGYHFLILDSAEINAFAAPGGLIFISRGLLACADNEDAVAAILAHEIGHVVKQHGINAIKKSRKTEAIMELIKYGAEKYGPAQVGKLTSIFTGTIDDIVSTLVNSGYSRNAEKEADLAAVEILKAAGYDPRALARMLQVMDSRLPSGGPGFGKTHPDPEDRIASIQGALASAPVPPAAPAARQSRYQAALGKI